MNKLEWRKRSSNLRRLIAELQPPHAATRSLQNRRYAYNFSAVIHPETKLWYVYNCLSENIIATVRFVDGGENAKVVIRYRPNSRYAGILSGIKWHNDGTETLHAASHRLSRRSRWVREQLHARTRRHFDDVRVEIGVTQNIAARLASYDPFPLRSTRPVRLRDSRGRFISRREATLRQQQMNNEFMRLQERQMARMRGRVVQIPTEELLANPMWTSPDMRPYGLSGGLDASGL